MRRFSAPDHSENESACLQTGTRTFQLAAPTPQDIGYPFYVISLW